MITGIPCQLDMSGGESQIQFFSPPPEGKNRLSLLVCLEHPLSRGTVHITSSDPNKAPRIDPGYFRNGADAKILAEGIKWMDKVAKRPILAKSLGERIQPPASADIESEEARVDFVKNHISTQYHLIGTCTMGEVVDDTLKVKGAKKLRVIDASVFPGHVSGNIMASVSLRRAYSSETDTDHIYALDVRCCREGSRSSESRRWSILDEVYFCMIAVSCTKKFAQVCPRDDSHS